MPQDSNNTRVEVKAEKIRLQIETGKGGQDEEENTEQKAFKRPWKMCHDNQSICKDHLERYGRGRHIIFHSLTNSFLKDCQTTFCSIHSSSGFQVVTQNLLTTVRSTASKTIGDL